MEIKSLAKKRQFRYGSRAVALTIAVLAAAVGLYLGLSQKNIRWDTTANKDFTLSQQTRDVLNNLDEKVEILAFFGLGEDLDDVFIRRRVGDILKEYVSRSSKLSYKMVDPKVDVEIASQYEIAMDGVVVFLNQKRRKDVYKSQLFDYSRGSETSLPDFSGEGLFTNAILKVLQESPPVIYFLTGHQEKNLLDLETEGLSQIHEFLKNNNYEVRSLNFVTTPHIPEDCNLLVIAGARRRLGVGEDKLIRDYSRSGKPLLILEDSLASPGLELTLKELGVTLRNDLVLDPKRHFILGAHYPAPNLESHKINRGLEGLDPVLSLARSLSFKERDGWLVEPLLTTTVDAWGETHLKDGTKPKFTQGVDFDGPLTLGVAVSKGETPRAVVVGDSQFVANELIAAPGNLDLFLNMVGWLVQDDSQITIRPKTPDFRNISMTPKRATFIKYFSQFGYPLFVFGLGGIYWIRRRRK